jgi:3-deoxy-7-phosphoheptulonate synthase
LFRLALRSNDIVDRVTSRGAAIRRGAQRNLASYRELGFKDHVSRGAERTVIGVLGPVYAELQDEFAALGGVDSVVGITKPFKLASREVKEGDAVVRVGSLEIGEGT